MFKAQVFSSNFLVAISSLQSKYSLEMLLTTVKVHLMPILINTTKLHVSNNGRASAIMVTSQIKIVYINIHNVPHYTRLTKKQPCPRLSFSIRSHNVITLIILHLKYIL